jgi:hypothetical protein
MKRIEAVKWLLDNPKREIRQIKNYKGNEYTNTIHFEHAGSRCKWFSRVQSGGLK